MLRILSAIFLLLSVLTADPIAAHVITSNETIVNYEGLKGGPTGNDECCGGKDCRAASLWWYDKSKQEWVLRVKRLTSKEDTREIDVRVPESAVTPADLGDHNAHWCGTFKFRSDEVEFQRCTFIPPPQNAGLWQRVVEMWHRVVSSIFGSAQAHTSR